MPKKYIKRDRSELAVTEYHPSADSALRWYKVWATDFQRYMLMKESLASTAIENNRLAEICLGTIHRIENKEPVSDRYLLGLVWFLRGSVDLKERNRIDSLVDNG